MMVSRSLRPLAFVLMAGAAHAAPAGQASAPGTAGPAAPSSLSSSPTAPGPGVSGSDAATAMAPPASGAPQPSQKRDASDDAADPEDTAPSSPAPADTTPMATPAPIQAPVPADPQRARQAPVTGTMRSEPMQAAPPAATGQPRQATQPPPLQTAPPVRPAPAPVADATPPIATSCMQIASDSTPGGVGGFAASHYSASIPGTTTTIAINQVTINDPNTRLSEADASGLSALAALGALSAALGHAPLACQDEGTVALTHRIAADIQAGAQPHIIWHGITLHQGSHNLTATSLEAMVRPDQTSGLLRLSGNAAGIAESASTSVVPSDVSIDIAAPGSALLSLGSGGVSVPLIVHDVHATIAAPDGAVLLSGKGRALMAPDPHNTNADGHVTVTNLSALVALARRSNQPALTTAMSIGGLVGHHAGDETSWDIKYADNLVIINNIPLPLSVH